MSKPSVPVVPLTAWERMPRSTTSPQLRRHLGQYPASTVVPYVTDPPKDVGEGARLIWVWCEEKAERLIQVLCHDGDYHIVYVRARIGRRWHRVPALPGKSNEDCRAEAIATAEGAAAFLRERHAPSITRDDEAWLRNALGEPRHRRTRSADGWHRRLARGPRTGWESVDGEDLGEITLTADKRRYDAREHRSERGLMELLPSLSPADIAWARSTGRYVVMFVVYDVSGSNRRFWADVCILRRKRGDTYRMVKTLQNPKDPFRVAEATFRRLGRARPRVASTQRMIVSTRSSVTAHGGGQLGASPN
jgi:hypothetical protein